MILLKGPLAQFITNDKVLCQCSKPRHETENNRTGIGLYATMMPGVCEGDKEGKDLHLHP